MRRIRELASRLPPFRVDTAIAFPVHESIEQGPDKRQTAIIVALGKKSTFSSQCDLSLNTLNYALLRILCHLFRQSLFAR